MRLPAQGAGLSQTQAAAGGAYHTAPLRSDSAAAANGSDSHGLCGLPALGAVLSHTQAAAGANQAVPLRSDGAAAACGSEGHGLCASQLRALAPATRKPVQGGLNTPSR